MGDCYFSSIYYQHRGEKIKPIKHNIVISSEELGEMIGDNTQLQRTINATNGIFYYETSLWDKDELKKQLHKLVDDID